MNLDTFLERSAHVTLIVAALLVSARVGSVWLKPARIAPQTQDSRGLLGEVMADVQGKDVSGLRPARDAGGIIIFASASCAFCEQSLPFYRRLVSSTADSNVSVLLALAGTEPRSDERRKYIAEKKLDGVHSVDWKPLSKWGVRVTPTVISYDSRGIVQRAWVGRLGPQQEREVETGLSMIRK